MGLMDAIKGFLDVDDNKDREKDIEIIEDGFDIGGGSYEEETKAPASSGKGNKVLNIPVKTQFQVVLVKPEGFEDAKSVADHLNEKKTVVLNIESMTKDSARRWIDFLSGVAYANKGQLKKLSAGTYIITPYNVDLMGDLIGELETGLYADFN